ncbi:hypothetical protein [Deinococcus sp.]|uniref:hypothetical protein n=1 Tax=Deinococcus sp. TaxID=47478 RepID=UPI003B5CD3E9
MSGQQDHDKAAEAWHDLWHRAADGEALSALELAELSRALEDEQQRQQVLGWTRVAEVLRTSPAPPLPASVIAAAQQDRHLQQILTAQPALLPHSLAPELARDIALSRRLTLSAAELSRSLAPALATRIANDPPAPPPLSSAELAALLQAQPAPELPHSLAAGLAAQVATEARGESAEALPPLGRTRFNPPGGPSALGGLGVVLAFGGLTAVRGNEAAQQALGLIGASASAPFALPLPALLGVVLLALLSWLIVARPSPAVRTLGALAFAMTGVLTLPALWNALQQTPLHLYLAPNSQLTAERWLGAGALMAVTVLLLRGGRAAQLARRQRRAPLQTLAAGTLAGLGLTGLGLLLLAFGWTAAGTVLAFVSTLAAALGLSVSLYAVGKSVARRLHLALPELSGALTGVLALSASLSVPSLAAGLMVVGSAWGLGALLIGRSAARI